MSPAELAAERAASLARRKARESGPERRRRTEPHSFASSGDLARKLKASRADEFLPPPNLLDKLR